MSEVFCSCRIPRPMGNLRFSFPFPQVKTEVGKEVASARRKQHLSSLQYYCALNALQYRKRMAMMEPLIGFAHGQVGQPLPHGRKSEAVTRRNGSIVTETDVQYPGSVPGALLLGELPVGLEALCSRSYGLIPSFLREEPACLSLTQESQSWSCFLSCSFVPRQCGCL